jgi:predicted 2-oxoglutarate/Fe(II)-dependent dioxygenase YbiX
VTVSVAPNVMPVSLLTRFRDATKAAYESQGDSQILWRLAELDRALGNLPAAAEEYGDFAKLQDTGKAHQLSGLMSGASGSPDGLEDGVVPFLLVKDLAPEAKLVEIRQALEERRQRFAEAKVRSEGVEYVDVNTRVALFVRADAEFQAMARGFFRRAIEDQNVLARLGVEPLSEVTEEVEAIAYASGGKYAIHRDRALTVDNGRRLTVVWFIHDEPKGFSGGDLLLHDEPPAGQGFTRIVPERNLAVFFPSHCLHEVTPVESTVEDVLCSRVVLNGWFHKA